MPCFICTNSRDVDMSARGRHADEAFISPTTNEPVGAHATAQAVGLPGVRPCGHTVMIIRNADNMDI